MEKKSTKALAMVFSALCVAQFTMVWTMTSMNNASGAGTIEASVVVPVRAFKGMPLTTRTGATDRNAVKGIQAAKARQETAARNARAATMRSAAPSKTR